MFVMLMTVSTAWAYQIPALKNASDRVDPHNEGYWVVLNDRFGGQSWYELHEYDDGSYATSVSLDYATYGGYRPGIDPVRQVPFIFMFYGIQYGAIGSSRPIVLGDALSNPLTMVGESYTVDVGYNYTIGIYFFEDGQCYAFASKSWRPLPGDPADYADDYPEVTATPVITWTVDEEAQTVTVVATGNGTVILYNDDIEVACGEGEATYVVPFTEDPEGEEMGFSATAQEDGKVVSEYVLTTVYVPGKPAVTEVTATPEIILDWNYDEEYVMIHAEGDGVVKLYIDDIMVSNPFMYRFQDEEHEILVEATAQEDGKEISETAIMTVVIPAKTSEPPTPEVTETPTISYFVDMDNEVVVVTATGNGHIILMWDEQVMAEGEGTATWEIPFCDEPDGEEYGVSATAQEEGKEVSEPALATVYVPALYVEPYETPAPEIYTELTDDAFVITAVGEGTVTLYIQYIDNETGEMTEESYSGEGTVVVPVARVEEDTFINYWASAQANEDATISYTEVDYYVEVPAKEGEPGPWDEHNYGEWLVILDKNGNEVWYNLTYDNVWDENELRYFIDYSDCKGRLVPVDIATFGNYQERGFNVPLYVVIDGVRYGADQDMKPLSCGNYYGTSGNMASNALTESQNHFTVELGKGEFFGTYLLRVDYENGVPMLSAADYVWPITGMSYSHFVALTDKDGNVVKHSLGNEIDLSCEVYGNGDVPFYFYDAEVYPDGEMVRYTYGAQTDMLPAEVGDPFAQRLYSGNKKFTVPAGSRYRFDYISEYLTDAEGWLSFNRYLFVEKIEKSTVLGDVDNDGIVNIGDVVALIDYIVSQNAGNINLDNADCDPDGIINIGDVVAMIDYILFGTW